MRKSFLVTGLLTLALSGTAGAGAVGNRAKVSYDSIGVRAKGQAPAEVKAGDVLQTEVVGAQKLAGFGLEGIKEGDAVEVKVLEAGKRFEVKHVASGRTVTLVADDQGALKIAPAAAAKARPDVRPAPTPAGQKAQSPEYIQPRPRP
jgi:hypothetical protein